MIRMASLCICAWLGISISTPAFAAGFQISETGVTDVGRAFAGAGVSADGAADMFYNPAGLMLGGGEIFEVGAHSIKPDFQFSGGGTITTPAGTNPSGGNPANGGVDAIVPNLYYANDWNQNTRFGIGITAPFGLTTEYPADWVGRYHAVKTSLTAVEVNPAVAVRINEKFSIGGGITFIQADAELSQALLNGTATDGFNVVKGDAKGYGFNLGAVIGDADARIGFGYRSSTDLDIEGSFRASGVPMPTQEGMLMSIDTTASTKLTLPATAYLSGFAHVNDKVDLLGGIRWTDWSEFDELRIKFGILDDAITPHNWRDSLTYSIGVNYRRNPNWTWRAGYAIDKTPIGGDSHRTAQIPDADRNWLTVGGSWRASAKMRIDFYAARISSDATVIDESIRLSEARQISSQLNGRFAAGKTDLFAVQLHLTR